jgi:agmatine deiminase
MITDNQTNKVYFSEQSEKHFPKRFSDLKKIIEEAGYFVHVISKTKDYYCRDYMPVQVDVEDFVQFVFRPEAYLKPEEYKFITNPVVVNLTNKIVQPSYSPVLLDGGNIVKWGNKVIITDRVIKDNEYQFGTPEAVIAQLVKDLKCRVIIIPEYPKEKTGHADGLIRFIDENRVFINETEGEPKQEWLKEFKKVLDDNGLKSIELPCPMPPEQETAIGLYLNYLHVGNLVVVPQFNKPEDKPALDAVKDIFGADNKVVGYDARWIAEHGGVFNCCTWTLEV